jgi:hypothetical protein
VESSRLCTTDVSRDLQTSVRKKEGAGARPLIGMLIGLWVPDLTGMEMGIIFYPWVTPVFDLN